MARRSLLVYGAVLTRTAELRNVFLKRLQKFDAPIIPALQRIAPEGRGVSNWCFIRFGAFNRNNTLAWMAMTRPVSVSQFRSEFDLFLYASVEETGSEAHLSVLSALARLDVDPWQEAANLTRMSRESATQRLAALIDTLPGKALAHSNCIAVAARLIALLPSQASTRIVTLEAAADGAVPTQMRPIIYLVIINAVFMALTFGGHYLTANSRPAKQAESARASIGQKSNPHVPLPSADKK